VLLPRGPIFTNRANTVEAVYSELIAKSAKILKSNELLKISDVFAAAGRDKRLNPMIMGFGNRQSAALAYNIAGLAPQSIFLIDETSTIRIWEGPPPVNLPSVNFIRSSTPSSEYGSVVHSISGSSSGTMTPRESDREYGGLRGDGGLKSAGSELLSVTDTMDNCDSPRGVSQSKKFSPKFDEQGKLEPNFGESKLNTAALLRENILNHSEDNEFESYQSHGQIISYVDDEGVTHSAVFSTYKDSELWRYADLLANHHDKKYQEIQRLVHEELMLSEALEAANHVNAFLKSASVNLKFMEALHSNQGANQHDGATPFLSCHSSDDDD